MPLIAFVPISLRKNDTALGNQISFIPTNLGTNNPDAIARLRLIHDSVQAGKMRAGRMTQAEFINYTAVHYAWAGINLAMRLYPAKQAFNLIISNIPGDSTPLYLNGAKLTAMYPASVYLMVKHSISALPIIKIALTLGLRHAKQPYQIFNHYHHC